jgi:hypothetical protein
MMQRTPIQLPELDWTGAGDVPEDFNERYRDVAVQAAARGANVLTRTFRGLQSGQRGVTDVSGRAVLHVTKNKDVCEAFGHQIVARPWKEVPGHYENWHRLIGCQCGRILELQSCHNYQNPSLNFLPAKKVRTP